jgi:hypothetical protein
MGGPRNSLNRNYHYSIENDINFIAERLNNTNVGFVNVFRRNDKTWMNRQVRSVNLSLDWFLLGCGKSHIGVFDTLSFLREDFTTHGLHLHL